MLAQGRSEAPEWLPDLPSIEHASGTHEYVFENNRLTLPPDTLLKLADHMYGLRERAAKHLLGSLVMLEKHCRDWAAMGGRKGTLACERYLSVVGADDAFYQRVIDDDGGWLQHLVRGELSVDKSDPSAGSRAEPYFFLNRRDPRDVFDNVGPFFAEWSDHAGWIRYCLEHGDAEHGRTWVVPTEKFESNPPAGLPISTLARSAVLQRRMGGDGTVSCVVTMFEEDGRTSREYRSLWAGTQPKKLEEIDFFAGSAQLNSVRKISILRRSREARVPDLLDVAIFPVEQYSIIDTRGDPDHKIDVRDLGNLASEKSVDDAVPGVNVPPVAASEVIAAHGVAGGVEPERATLPLRSGDPEVDSIPLVDLIPREFEVNIRDGNPKHVTFHVSNLTADTLEILDVKSSCGCAALKIERKTIPAYEASRIDMTISTKDPKVVSTTIMWRLGERTGEVIAKVDCVGKAATQEPPR